MSTPRMTKDPASQDARPDPPPAVGAPGADRAAAGERSTVALLGLVLLALGVLVTLLSLGVFGAARAGLPVVDPVVLDALRSQPVVARIAAIVAGLLLLVLGLLRVVRSLRPEPRPDLVLDPGPQTAISISSSAAADAVAAQAGTLPGVCRAKVRLVGTRTAPAARITVWLDEDADIREVCRRLDEVLASARDCFGLAAMPVAVRLELDSGPGQNSRVA